MAFAALPFPSVAAQTGEVLGRVISVAGAPVPGAMVRLLGRRDSLRTSDDGEFHFRAVVADEYRIEVRAIGYIPWHVSVRVREREGWSGVIVMDRVPQELPGLGQGPKAT